jgi:hypothetical protein
MIQKSKMYDKDAKFEFLHPYFRDFAEPSPHIDDNITKFNILGGLPLD